MPFPQAPFVVHLRDGQIAARLSREGQIFLQNGHVISEYVVDRKNRIWRLSGAEDCYFFTTIGCGCGEFSRPELEPVLGVVLQARGYVQVLGRTYLPGQKIDVRAGHVRVDREPGYNAPMYVATSTSRIAFVWGADQEWWRGVPRAPDVRFFSPARYWATDSLAGGFLQWADQFVAASPGAWAVDSVIGAMFRTAEGCATNLLLFPIGPYLAIGFAMLTLATYWCRTIIGLPYALLCGIAAHIKRAATLNL